MKKEEIAWVGEATLEFLTKANWVGHFGHACSVHLRGSSTRKKDWNRMDNGGGCVPSALLKVTSAGVDLHRA